jgi:hypothetical protein
MNARAAIVPHAVPDLRRYAILRSVADALRDDDDATGIAPVLAAAGVSRRELAREFGGIGQLLVSLAAMFAASLLEPLAACTTEAALLSRLRDFAGRMLDGSPGLQLRRLHRIALAEAAGDPALGRAFYRQGPGMVADELSRFFRAAQYVGLLPAGDCRRLADHFIALLRCRWQLAGQARGECDSARIVDAFWRGVQAERGDAPAAR